MRPARACRDARLQHYDRSPAPLHLKVKPVRRGPRIPTWGDDLHGLGTDAMQLHEIRRARAPYRLARDEYHFIPLLQW